jgi:prepilin-type processing-associated H-X9-DG protein
MKSNRTHPLAFTLVELLVVVGIIAVLVGLLLPTLANAQRQAKTLQCLSQMRTVGQSMAIYSSSNGGWLFPTDAGGPTGGVDINLQWFVYVMNIHGPMNQLDEWHWCPPTLRCPEDLLDPSGSCAHSYVLNDHLNTRHVKYSSRPPHDIPVSSIVVMGEKKTALPDFYIQQFVPDQTSDYGPGSDQFGSYPPDPPPPNAPVAELYRHSPKYGSNYLFLDLHAETSPPRQRFYAAQLDPWDPGPGP